MSITVTTPTCPLCSRPGQVQVPDAAASRLQAFLAGEDHIQILLPELSPDEREMLITGTHPRCWDELFADTEDED